MVTDLIVKPRLEQAGKRKPFVCAFKSMNDNGYEATVMHVIKQLAEQFGMSVVMVDMAFYTSGIRDKIPSGSIANDVVSQLENSYNKSMLGLLDYFHYKYTGGKSNLEDVIFYMNVNRGKALVLPAKRKLYSYKDFKINRTYALDLITDLVVKESCLWDVFYNDLMSLCLGIDIILINTPLGLNDYFNNIALHQPSIDLVFCFSDRVDTQKAAKNIIEKIVSPCKIITVVNNFDSLFNKSLITGQNIPFRSEAITDNILAMYNKK